MASLRELEDALSDAGPAERLEGQTQNSQLHQECLDYLNTYGTHLSLISFYVRHDCLTDALTYLINKVKIITAINLQIKLDTLFLRTQIW